MLRTLFLAKCHFLPTLTAKEASTLLFGLPGRAEACLRPLLVVDGCFWQVRIEYRFARFEGCKILQLTLSGIFRLKILSTKSEIRNNLELPKLEFSKQGPHGQTKTGGNRQTGAACLTDQSKM